MLWRSQSKANFLLPCSVVSSCYFVGSTEVLGRVGWVGETSFCCHLGRLFRYLNSMVTLLQECAVLPFFSP